MRSLARADRDWPAGMITRRMGLAQWQEAFQPPRDQVETVISLPGCSGTAAEGPGAVAAR